MEPRVLIHGSGFAGKGHTMAFRTVGAEVVGIVSRTASVVQSVAEELDIPFWSTDWESALAELEPNTVSIATPGGAHPEPIRQALAHGCHIYCDKPLAPTAEDARSLHQAAENAGVRTAYAASFCYEPSVLHAARLIREGAIGRPNELEFSSHYEINPLIPYAWSHSLSAGGGRLNNNFTHKLSIALRLTEGLLQSVAGEARNDMKRAPEGTVAHDFRERERFAPAPADTADIEWRAVDSDWSYTVLAGIRLSDGEEASAYFRHGGLQPRVRNDYIAVYGTTGSLYIEEAYGQGPVHLKRGNEWEQQPLPPDIAAAVPKLDGNAERNWASLAREFVKDLNGEPHESYLTFRDGWIFQEAIDAVRRRSGFHRLPNPS